MIFRRNPPSSNRITLVQSLHKSDLNNLSSCGWRNCWDLAAEAHVSANRKAKFFPCRHEPPCPPCPGAQAHRWLKCCSRTSLPFSTRTSRMWIALIFRWAFPYNDKHAVRWAGQPALPAVCALLVSKCLCLSRGKAASGPEQRLD